MNKLIRNLLAAGVAAGIVGVATGDATAAPGDLQVVYGAAASACIKGSTGTLGYDPWNLATIKNTSTSSSANFDCSLPNGSEDPNAPTGLAFVLINGFDSSSTAAVTCTVSIMNAEGYLLYRPASKSSGASASELLPFELYWPMPIGLDGAAFVGCKLPKADPVYGESRLSVMRTGGVQGDF
jgi:hypothetical protein